MVIEFLKFHVSPELREQFVQKDTEIWTPALSKQAGYLGKEVWISPDDLAEVIVISHWESFELWHAVPEAELQQVESQFKKAMGNNTYQLVESAGYQVRKFS